MPEKDEIVLFFVDFRVNLGPLSKQGDVPSDLLLSTNHISLEKVNGLFFFHVQPKGFEVFLKRSTSKKVSRRVT